MLALQTDQQQHVRIQHPVRAVILVLDRPTKHVHPMVHSCQIVSFKRRHHTWQHPLQHVQSHSRVHTGKECVPLQSIVPQVVLGIIELQVVLVNPGCDLKREAKQPLQVLHLLLVLVRLLEVRVPVVKDLQD